MSATDTSKKAYKKLKSVGELSRLESLVYRQIKYMESQAPDEEHLPSRRDIARELGLETSSVSGRVNALIAYGLVGEKRSLRRDKTTGMTVGVLYTKNPSAERLVRRIVPQDEPEQPGLGLNVPEVKQERVYEH